MTDNISVTFSSDIKIIKSDLTKEDRKNYMYYYDHSKAFDIACIIGSDELARRSLLRAENKCACNTESGCQSSKHNHENILNNGSTIYHCGNVKIINCIYCNKRICNLCLDNHIFIHSNSKIMNINPIYAKKKCSCNNDLKCQSSKHNHHKVIYKFSLEINCENASLFKCSHCPKIVCEICWKNHIASHLNIT